MLGSGNNFGQFVFLVDEVQLEPRDALSFEFYLTENQKGRMPVIDLQANELYGETDQIDLSIEPILA